MQDIRKALDDKDLDAVSIATPNHWHSLMTIWACQAGKDVYVEKPCSHNVHEGRRCVEAARKYNRIVQHGTQQRSEPRPGQRDRRRPVGQVRQAARLARATATSRAGASATSRITTPPAELDFNLWLGPAPEQPYHANLVHYNWHWFWDFGNGDIGNQGVHEMDVARWAIPGATLPTKVWSLGGRFGYDDQGQTPNTQMAVMEFGDVLLVFEVRGLVDKTKDKDFPFKFKVPTSTTRPRAGSRTGSSIPRTAAKPEPLAKFDVKVTPGGRVGQLPPRRPQPQGGGPQRRRPSTATTPAPSATWPTSPTASARKSRSTARRRRWATTAKSSTTFMNLQENLKGVGVRLDETTYQLGRTLTVDPANERFVGEGCGGREPPAQPAVPCAVRRAGKRVVGVEPMSGALNIRHRGGAVVARVAASFLLLLAFETAGMSWTAEQLSRRALVADPR